MFRICAILLSTIALYSCDSTQVDNTSLMVPNTPYADRQTLSLETSVIKVNITLNNSGVVQTFDLAPNQVTISAPLVGVRINESNSIYIKWVEILNGFEVELAETEGVFIAAGDIVVSASLRASRFDYDNDGTSNYNERLDETCVWSASEICVNDGVPDIPREGEVNVAPAAGVDVFIGPTFSQSGTLVSADEVDPATATIVDEDFSNGIVEWDSVEPIRYVDASTCVDFQPGGVLGFQKSILGFNSLFDLDPGVYVAQADLRATRSAPVSIVIYQLDTPRAILDHWVDVTVAGSTHTIRFESFAEINPERPTFGLAFSALRDNTETTYCIDNVKVVKISP